VKHCSVLQKALGVVIIPLVPENNDYAKNLNCLDILCTI